MYRRIALVYLPLLKPTHTQILVIGGGPGGSFAAASLAREGFEVTLFEADKFPRYHIGESLLPSVRPLLQFVGAEKKVMEHGFAPKVCTWLSCRHGKLTQISLEQQLNSTSTKGKDIPTSFPVGLNLALGML